MFTGIIEQTGVVESTGTRLLLKAQFGALVLGESIAVDGVCLTLVEAQAGKIAFDISPETLDITTLGKLQAGDTVHLERALRAEDRLGGHYVTGHVDTKAHINKLIEKDGCMEVTIGGFTPEDMRYFCPKGSAAVNGVSLTINAVTTDTFTVMLIPHTLEKTTFSSLKLNQLVNIEYDYIARIVVHQLGSLKDSSILALSNSPDMGKEVLV